MRPRHLSALLLFAAIPLLSAAQENSAANAQSGVQAAPPVKSLPDTGRITGSIFCNDTHRPARGALAVAQFVAQNGHTHPGSGMHMGRVGLDGTYTIEHLHPGNYTVIGLLPGYLSPLDDIPADQMESDSSAADAQLALNGFVSVRNDDTARFDVTLQRGASVAGRVLYSDGSPATQVVLSVEDVNAKPPRASDHSKPGLEGFTLRVFIRGLLLHQSAGTDDQGNFRIAGLSPGTYRIAAVQPASDPLTGNEEDSGLLYGMIVPPHALHIYSGDTFHKSSAKTYDLRAGDTVTGIEITIPTDALHHVEGHLTTLDGRPVAVASLTFTDTSDDSFVLRASPSRDGAFSFPFVPSGTYKLAATGARVGTLPDGFPDGVSVDASLLKDAHALSDGSVGVIVKDDDVSDVTLQLANAPPAAPSSP